ncbi:MAG: hypothetical protein K6F37_03060 [Lachnospiraceae bacterium]|nr:hypothetical protein [Lachnospiraceae bacterium]
MNTLTIVLIVILVVLAAAAVALYFFGKKADKAKTAQDQIIEETKQTVSMLIIDKKKMKLKDAGLPSYVIEQTPWWVRRSKAPIVKAKVGPKVMTFLCENSVYDLVPVKKEVKVTISGLYIVDVKGIRGNLEAAPKKKSLTNRLTAKYNEYRAENNNTGKKKK